MNLDELMLKCLPIVKEAGSIVRDNWNKAHDTRHKGPIDLVTETDVAVEKFLHGELGRVAPEAAFVGEESGADPALLEKLCWVVDPVDGTTNFVHKIPYVGVSVALCDGGSPALGIIDAPMLGETYYAAMDSRAFCNGEPIAVSSADNIKSCLVATGFPYNTMAVLPKIMGYLGKVMAASQGVRRLGAASLDLAYVAAGRLDAFYEGGLKPWDVAAGWIIVRQAGGQISDFSGNAYKLGEPILASNGLAHKAMLELLAEDN